MAGYSSRRLKCKKSHAQWGIEVALLSFTGAYEPPSFIKVGRGYSFRFQKS